MKIDPFGKHAQALMLRAQRNEVLATNIANSDTPNFKARDFDFKSALAGEQGQFMPMQTTRAGHIGADTSMTTSEALSYRIPMQPSLDGNSVESDIEQAAYAENVIGYQASLSFINSKIGALRLAIKGGS